jgi:predicted Zn-dependent protease
MAQSRIEIFAEMAKQQPEDAMIRYGLASEYLKAERWLEAVDALQTVIRINPDYTAAYQLLGTALANDGQAEEARRAWTEGIEVAKRTGAWKAQQHMEGLLASTTTNVSQPGSEFCD